MIIACRDYLVNKLKTIGINDVRISAAASTKHQARLYAEVVIGKEATKRDGGLVAKKIEGQAITYRRKLYVRVLPIQVILHHRSGDELISITDQFLKNLDGRIWDENNNAVLLEVNQIQSDEDSGVAAQRAEVTYLVEFYGGIYKDITCDLLPYSENMVIEGGKDE